MSRIMKAAIFVVSLASAVGVGQLQEQAMTRAARIGQSGLVLPFSDLSYAAVHSPQFDGRSCFFIVSPVV